MIGATVVAVGVWIKLAGQRRKMDVAESDLYLVALLVRIVLV
jgi:hypothetical protein